MIITFFIMCMIMLLRYFILAGGAYALTRRNDALKSVTPVNVKRDITWSVLSSFIFALSATALIEMWKSEKIILNDEFTFKEIGLFFILVFLQDAYFYWTHRLLHLPRFYRPYHEAHHQSRQPTAWTSFSFHPVEAFMQALFLPVVLYFMPVHLITVASFLFIMTFFGITNHLGFEIFPKSFVRSAPIITATHHQVHHQYYGSNFGLFFTTWDKWMGTERE